MEDANLNATMEAANLNALPACCEQPAFLVMSSFDGGYDPDEIDREKKQNHSEIEKRRRNKMNYYITELSKIIPVCGGSSRKLDKLTVLRMAVQHMRTIRGNMNASSSGCQIKPSFLSDTGLQELLLQVCSILWVLIWCLIRLLHSDIRRLSVCGQLRSREASLCLRIGGADTKLHAERIAWSELVRHPASQRHG